MTRVLSGLRKRIFLLFALLALVIAPGQAFADELNSGDTAWMLTSTALVLFMTIPGLALFYGGLVRVKNVLSVLMQCFALTAARTILAESQSADRKRCRIGLQIAEERRRVQCVEVRTFLPKMSVCSIRRT